MRTNIIVREMIDLFAIDGETIEETKDRVLDSKHLVTKIYNQVQKDFSSEKSLRSYIKKNII